jgi:hypothetical protein
MGKWFKIKLMIKKVQEVLSALGKLFSGYLRPRTSM